jgi:hypothetical protein
MGGAFFATMTTTTATAASTAPAKKRPTFVLELRAAPGVDPILALRRLLKDAWRCYGLKCIAAHENNKEQP